MSQTINVYYCECCDYTTENRQSILRHTMSSKHVSQCKEISYICDVDSKITLYTCKTCKKHFKNISSKKSHQRLCKSENVNINCKVKTPIKKIQQVNSNTVDNQILNNQDVLTILINKLVSDNAKFMDYLMVQKPAQDNKHADQMEKLIEKNNEILKESFETIKTTIETNATVALKSMSVLKYATLNLNNAPPLTRLKDSQIYGILEYKGNNHSLNEKQKEEENESFVKIIVGKYENKDLSKFLGETIVEYFKKQSKNDKNEFDIELSPLWSVDAARLSFIIMQPINKEGKKKWTKDKSGKLFTNMVTIPVLNILDSIIRTFLDNKVKWEKKQKTMTMHQMDYLIEIRQQCANILNDIKYNKLIRPILREVAPCFQFNDYFKTNQE